MEAGVRSSQDHDCLGHVGRLGNVRAAFHSNLAEVGLNRSSRRFSGKSLKSIRDVNGRTEKQYRKRKRVRMCETQTPENVLGKLMWKHSGGGEVYLAAYHPPLMSPCRDGMNA